MVKRLLVLFILGLISVNFVYAESIGTFELGQDVELYQTCNNCTSCNFTQVKYQNGSNILTNVQTIRNNTYYFFTLDGGNITTLGDYRYCYECGNNVTLATLTGCLDFTISQRGRNLNIQEALIYIFLTIAVSFIFLLSFYFAIATPYKNKIDENTGAVIKVTKLKYVKLCFIAISYLMFVWVLNTLIGLSDNFVSLRMYEGFIGFLFITLNYLAFPFGIFILVLCLFEIIKDANIQKNIEKFGSAMR